LLIYPKLQADPTEDPTLLIEHDAASTQHLLQLFKKYILRSKIKVRDASSEVEVWNINRTNTNNSAGHSVADTGLAAELPLSVLGAGLDPRSTKLGIRVVCTKGSTCECLFILIINVSSYSSKSVCI
jgi:hypothetical protein